MRLTNILAIKQNDQFWYRIWGYWRSPGVMRTLNLWSDRKEQQYKTLMMTYRGKGKSRPDNVYEKLLQPKYNIKWVKKQN